jgi:hypothetical protein
MVHTPFRFSRDAGKASPDAVSASMAVIAWGVVGMGLAEDPSLRRQVQ